MEELQNAENVFPIHGDEDGPSGNAPEGSQPKKRGRKKKEEVILSAIENFARMQREQAAILERLIEENQRLQRELEKSKYIQTQYKKLRKLVQDAEG